MKFVLALVAIAELAIADFRSGSVSSREHFTYGKFVARMKAPDKKGTVSSFFTYWDGPDFNPVLWNELDFEIVPSVTANPLSTNMIYGNGVEKGESHQYANGFNPKDEWHTYSLEWTPKYVSWSVDGHEVRHADITDPAIRYMHQPQTLRMNLWTPTFNSWGRGLQMEDMPWYLMFDYVEVFKYDEGANEFNLHWRDDFNAFDSARWHKASGTFEANSSTFHSQNVYAEEGNLVIKMEPEKGGHQTHFGGDLTDLGKAFPREHLNAKADSIDIPAVHDAFTDSHLFDSHSASHSDEHSHHGHYSAPLHHDSEEQHHKLTYEEFLALKHGHHSAARRHLSDSDDSDHEQHYEHHHEKHYEQPHQQYREHQQEFRHHEKSHASRKDYDEEEQAWHTDHHRAHDLHSHHKPQRHYEHEHSRHYSDSDSSDSDDYIENPYAFEMEWKSKHHHHEDADLDYHFAKHEDHWEEHFQAGQKKKTDAQAPTAQDPTKVTVDVTVKTAPSTPAAPQSASKPAKAHHTALADHHYSAHHQADYHESPVYDLHQTEHHHREVSHEARAASHHGQEVHHDTTFVKTHGDQDVQTDPLYEPHHAKHDPVTQGWMEQFEAHEHSHHQTFHKQTPKTTEEHHYLDESHMPYHYDEEVHHPEFVHAPHHVQHGHSYEHVYEHSDAEHEYDDSEHYWEQEEARASNYSPHEYSEAHIALVESGMQNANSCAWDNQPCHGHWSCCWPESYECNHAGACVVKQQHAFLQ